LLLTVPQGLARQSTGMRVDTVSLIVPFTCEDLIVRIISNGLTWDSSSSSHIHVDQDGICVCPVDFGVSDDVIIAVYSSSFVKPIASVAFHTLVSVLVPSSCFVYRFRPSYLSADSCPGERRHVTVCSANNRVCLRWSISLRLV
jgi:hypothetical protein